MNFSLAPVSLVGDDGPNTHVFSVPSRVNKNESRREFRRESYNPIRDSRQDTR